MDIDWSQVDPLLEKALDEDAVSEDITTRSLISPDWNVRAVVVAREEGVICGLPLLERICTRFAGKLATEFMLEDGALVEPDMQIACVAGAADVLLGVERTVLNLLQRLSGVASLTRRYVNAVAGTGVDILDTRKTTPGWRAVEKYAVRCGGGINHRMNLQDQAMVKENHLRLVENNLGIGRPESVAHAVRTIKKAAAQLPLTIEVEDLVQLRAALAHEPDIVLLDNMPPGRVRRSLECIDGVCGAGRRRPKVEVSGGITLAGVRSYALPGVDRISVGALTHSAPSLDIALNIIPE